MYRFTALGKPRAIDHNIKLAHELKDKFGFVYAVCFSSSFIYICSQGNARDVRKMAIEASTDTQSSRNPSTTYGSRIEGTMV